MPDLKEEIFRIIPDDVRGKLIGDELFFLCPNPEHDDHDPSCSVNLKTGIFYCFGCGFKGNLKKLKRIFKDGANKYREKVMEDPFFPTKKRRDKFVW